MNQKQDYCVFNQFTIINFIITRMKYLDRKQWLLIDLILNQLQLILIFLIIMGLLKDWGIVFSYNQSKQYQEKLKKVAASQFLEVFRKYKYWSKEECNCEVLWGDQIEGHRLCFDEKKQYLKLSYKELPKTSFPLMVEFGRWMFEMIPDMPHKTKCNFKVVIDSFRNRYAEIHKQEDIYLTIPNVPFLGAQKKRILQEKGKFDNQATQSLFVDDQHITEHPRFPNLAKNIRQRRGKKVEIHVPLYHDKNTNMIQESIDQPFPGQIYMDAMAFGMGMACLQCTFSTKNITQARYIHDQLHILSPLFLSLTAGTPIFKGKLSNWDVRWKVIEDSVDDRTEQQYNPKSQHYQSKSRYSSSSYFISDCNKNLPQYNDLKLNINEQVLAHLKKESKQKQIQIDDKLLNHIGMLSSRDFLVIHQKFLDMDSTEFYLFQMLNSTNWNSVRFKIPIDDTIGWRVEFRTMEIQLTADQNAAFSLLIFIIVLMLNQIPNLNFYIPISKIDQNFKTAHLQNSLLKNKFHFRTNIFENNQPVIEELTIQQIFFGSENTSFEGLFGIFRKYFENPMVCPAKICQISPTLKIMQSIEKFIKQKVTGKRKTLAQWMRNFVRSHKSYNFDSIISQQVSTDLLIQLDKISKGEIKDQNFNKIFDIE